MAAGANLYANRTNGSTEGTYHDPLGIASPKGSFCFRQTRSGLPGYPAGRYLDILPCPAVYRGDHGLAKVTQVVLYIAGVFRRRPYELEMDRLRSLFQRLSDSLNSSASERRR